MIVKQYFAYLYQDKKESSYVNNSVLS